MKYRMVLPSHTEVSVTKKTSLSFTDRHAAFLSKVVDEGIYATTSAAVAAAVEHMMQEEQEREVILDAMANELHRRMKTPEKDYVTKEEAFSGAWKVLSSDNSD